MRDVTAMIEIVFFARRRGECGVGGRVEYVGERFDVEMCWWWVCVCVRVYGDELCCCGEVIYGMVVSRVRVRERVCDFEC